MLHVERALNQVEFLWVQGFLIDDWLRRPEELRVLRAHHRAFEIQTVSCSDRSVNMEAILHRDLDVLHVRQRAHQVAQVVNLLLRLSFLEKLVERLIERNKQAEERNLVSVLKKVGSSMDIDGHLLLRYDCLEGFESLVHCFQILNEFRLFSAFLSHFLCNLVRQHVFERPVAVVREFVLVWISAVIFRGIALIVVRELIGCIPERKARQNGLFHGADDESGALEFVNEELKVKYITGRSPIPQEFEGERRVRVGLFEVNESSFVFDGGLGVGGQVEGRPVLCEDLSCVSRFLQLFQSWRLLTQHIHAPILVFINRQLQYLSIRGKAPHIQDIVFLRIVEQFRSFL